MDWFIVDSMRNLSKNGYDVTLVSCMDKGFIERNSDYAKCINMPMSRGVSINDLFVIPWRLYKLFKREKYDIVYYTSPNVSLYASIAAKFAGIDCRYYSQCGLRYVSFSGFKRIIFKTVERLTCLLSSTIRAQSPKNMEFAINEKLSSPNKISVVGIGGTTGVDLKECDSFNRQKTREELRKRYHIPQDAFIYGYVGRVNADKGINELLTAFNELQNELPDIGLVLIGMIDDTNPVSQNLMQDAESNGKIVFTGNISPKEVYPHMSMFDVLTHPTYREGVGKVLQEAMGMTLPIITTNVPGPSEVVENGISGILVEPMNPDDLKEKMILLYNNHELRNSLAHNGRLRAEKYFNRPIMLDNILKDLDKIFR